MAQFVRKRSEARGSVMLGSPREAKFRVGGGELCGNRCSMVENEWSLGRALLPGRVVVKSGAMRSRCRRCY